MKHLAILLLHLLVVLSSANTKINPSLLEIQANLRSKGRHAAVVQGELQLRNLESVADLSKLLESGRQKLAATRLVLEQTPAATPAASAATPAATPAAAAGAAATTTTSSTTGADAVADLIQPPQLQPLALPSYGPTMQIDELADIQREQLTLRQKKLMVAQQERVIQGSEDDATKLQQLIDVNKQIAKRNEEALVLAQQHLTDRIRAYGERLASEASGTGGAASGSASGAAAGASGSSLIEAGSTDVQTVQTPNQADLISQFQSQLKSQADTIQQLQEMIFKRRRRHRRHKNTLPDENENDSDSEDGEPDSSDNTDNTPATS